MPPTTEKRLKATRSFQQGVQANVCLLLFSLPCKTQKKMLARQPDARLCLRPAAPTGEEAENVACQQQSWPSLPAWSVHAGDFHLKKNCCLEK